MSSGKGPDCKNPYKPVLIVIDPKRYQRNLDKRTENLMEILEFEAGVAEERRSGVEVER